MEQMYMIEIFVDKVTVFTTEDSSADKNLIIKIRFGPKTQFIIKEGQLVVSEDKKDDTIEVTESGRKQFSRVIRVGKSYLFPSYPDTIVTILSKFPLEIEIWDDDENEPEAKTFVGIGVMQWHTRFYNYLKETADATKLHEPITIKEVTTLYQECCCGTAGEISFILRLSALGDSIVTEFQQIMADPDKFCFRTNKTPSMFECKRIEGDDPNFCMVGSLYETTTLEDPDITDAAQKTIEVCTELQSCGIAGAGATTNVCEHTDTEPEKKHIIDKIRMGDIVGACGNSNCPLAQKIRAYIRNLDSYKKKANSLPNKEDNGTKKVCGACDCKDDQYHREECPENAVKEEKTPCSGCGGLVNVGETCLDKKNKHFKTGATPIELSPTGTPKPETQAQYVTSLPSFVDAMFRRDYIIQDYFNTSFHSAENIAKLNTASENDSIPPSTGHSTDRKTPGGANSKPTSNKTSRHAMGNTNVWVFNNTATYSGCTDIPEDKDCKCQPPKMSPPCRTFDCNCLAEKSNKASRKAHRPYCPLYKHKSRCPVTAKNEEEVVKKDDEDEEAEPLPYGLPPVQLGPCPVMGRPCSVPDGFARMYKTAAQPAAPPSYCEAGKVCCSKEYERVKCAIKDYMQQQKDHDMRCVNKFNVDTERRCCDKDQVLKALMGKECCGLHKLAIQETSKPEKSNQ